MERIMRKGAFWLTEHERVIILKSYSIECPKCGVTTGDCYETPEEAIIAAEEEGWYKGLCPECSQNNTQAYEK